MSHYIGAFGDDNFKAKVYDNLNWIVSENSVEQLKFLHEEITSIIEEGTENTNTYILGWIEDYQPTIEDIKEALCEIYLYITMSCDE